MSVIAALLVLPRTTSAQNFVMDRFTIAGGGSISTGGVYSVKGTVGQPEAGKLKGGSFGLAGGFWAAALAVQEPGAPLLRLTRSGGSIILPMDRRFREGGIIRREAFGVRATCRRCRCA